MRRRCYSVLSSGPFGIVAVVPCEPDAPSPPKRKSREQRRSEVRATFTRKRARRVA